MTRPVTPLTASVPAELPEPELQEPAAIATVLKTPRRRTWPPRYKRQVVARVPVDLARGECGVHRWAMVQHTPRIWQCQACTAIYEGPR